MATIDYSKLKLHHPARIMRAAGEVGATADFLTKTNEELVSMIRAKDYMDDDVLAEENPFFFPMQISSNRLDAYFTRMHETSLANYAEGLRQGTSFQNSHKWGELGFGRSLDGLFLEDVPDKAVLGWFYTVRGLDLNGINTDNLIRGIRTRLVHDVSIGFNPGHFQCSICNLDLFDWDCPHIPGFEYNVADGVDEDPVMEQAFAWVIDATLSEVSAVYKGASPGAAILKAETEARGGRISDKNRRIVQDRYRTVLPDAERSWPGASLTLPVAPGDTQPEANMPIDSAVFERLANSPWDGDAEWEPQVERLLVAASTEQDEQARQITELTDNLATAETRTADVLDQSTASETRAIEAEAQVAELEPLAQDGRQYRGDLIETALANGVRAHGDAFNADVYTPLLREGSLATIKQLSSDWAQIGDARFQSGRVSGDEHDVPESDTPAETDTTGVPDAAYQT